MPIDHKFNEAWDAVVNTKAAPEDSYAWAKWGYELATRVPATEQPDDCRAVFDQCFSKDNYIGSVRHSMFVGFARAWELKREAVHPVGLSYRDGLIKAIDIILETRNGADDHTGRTYNLACDNAMGMIASFAASQPYMSSPEREAVHPVDYAGAFKKRWDETNGGCDEHSARFWFEDGWLSNHTTEREAVQPVRMSVASALCQTCNAIENAIIHNRVQCGDCITFLQRALDTGRGALLERESGGWQPVDTILQDGTIIQLYTDRTEAAYWDNHRCEWIALSYGSLTQVTKWPIKWRPLSQYEEQGRRGPVDSEGECK